MAYSDSLALEEGGDADQRRELRLSSDTRDMEVELLPGETLTQAGSAWEEEDRHRAESEWMRRKRSLAALVD
jgi:hypothetical protein